MKIVLDTNIYISAYLTKSLASKILILGQRKAVEIFITDDIQNEVYKKLVTKFKASEGILEYHMSIIRKSTQNILPLEKVSLVKADPEDNIILECAKAVNADLIVSADKHLLKLKKFENAAIVHPKTLTWVMPDLFS
jgi:uncharacterized protein